MRDFYIYLQLQLHESIVDILVFRHNSNIGFGRARFRLLRLHSFIAGLRPFLRSRGGWGLAVSESRRVSSTKHSLRLWPRLL
jgi:hypothetical protein